MTKNFLKCIIIVYGITICAACSQQDDSFVIDFDNIAQQDPLVLMVKDRNNSLSALISDQISQALNYSKIPYQTLDLSILPGELVIPQETRVIAITGDFLNNVSIQKAEELSEFVARGNTLIFYSPPNSSRFSFLHGLKPFSAFETDTVAKGITFTDPVFPGFSGKSFKLKEASPHYATTIDEFTDEVKIHAVAETDSTVPVILSNKVGLGEVITYNSYSLEQKTYRGLLFSGILRGLSGIPFPVANASTIFLDDFPAPVYNEKIPPIDNEYDISHAEFVSNIWWPDMQALADTFNIDYTAVIAFNYNAAVVPPFDFAEWTSGKILKNAEPVEASIEIARRVRDSQHELGFHGYNHFSLWFEDWANERFMINAIQAARKRWIADELGPLPVTYVPPTNFIDQAGLRSLNRAMPSVKFVSSLYLGDVDDGGGREFGPDPFVPAFFNYPRVTSGSNMIENSLFEQHNLQLNTGIWNHFLHPDDVFQINQNVYDEFPSRNPLKLGWKTSEEYPFGLYQLLKERLTYTRENYPLTRFVTAEKGASIAKDWVNSLAIYKNLGDSLSIVTLSRPGYKKSEYSATNFWFAYVSKKNLEKFEHALSNKVQDIVSVPLWDGVLFQFSTKTDSLLVPELHSGISESDEQLAQTIETVLQQYRSYQIPPTPILPEPYVDTRLSDALNALEKNPEDYELQEKIIELALEFDSTSYAIDILEKRLLNNQQWHEEDVNRLITFYGYESAFERSTQFLDSLWNTFSDHKVLKLKSKLTEELGVGNDKFNAKWDRRELKLIKDPVERKTRETELARESGDWKTLKKPLLDLLSLVPESDTLYAHILQRYLWNEPADSVVSFVERSPEFSEAQFKPFAAQIASIYGYEKQNYTKALYWAAKDPEFSKQAILQWLYNQNRFVAFNRRANQFLTNDPQNDSLRSFAGRQLIYGGFFEEGNKLLYPLFTDNKPIDELTRSAVNDQIRFASYKEKKKLYANYPEFFSASQFDDLHRSLRKTEGVRGSVFGEYRIDNFDNDNARTGLSVEFGNRNSIYHLIKTENLYTASRVGGEKIKDSFYGFGYQLTSRLKEGALILRAGNSNVVFDQTFKPGFYASAGLTKDSSYTFARAGFEPVFTNTALQEDIFQLKTEFYREDPWAEGQFLTALSFTGRYFTESIADSELFGRLFWQYYQNNKLRVRPIAELSYATSTDPIDSGVPFFSPDNLFTQGLGADLRYRHPDIFDYKTLFEIELMGKNQNDQGLFITGRAEINHRFDNFWEISFSSEYSNSKIFRSNRYFVTISYFFRKTPDTVK